MPKVIHNMMHLIIIYYLSLQQSLPLQLKIDLHHHLLVKCPKTKTET